MAALMMPRAAPITALPLRCSGGSIVDSNGAAARIAGLGWFGMEGLNTPANRAAFLSLGVPQMLDAGPAVTSSGKPGFLQTAAQMGWNTIRLFVSIQCCDASGVTVTPPAGAFAANPSLAGKTGLQLLDGLVSLIKAAGQVMIICFACASAGTENTTGIPYDATYPVAKVAIVAGQVAARYATEPTVVGYDLANEPYTMLWGNDTTVTNATNYTAYINAVGGAILTAAPNVLLLVEPLSMFNGTYGPPIEQFGSNPKAGLTTAVATAFVASPHTYPKAITGWTLPTDATGLANHWHDNWGYLSDTGVCPIIVGEYGAGVQDVAFLKAFRDFMAPRKDGHMMWAIVPYSGVGVSPIATNSVDPEPTGWTMNILYGRSPSSVIGGSIIAGPAIVSGSLIAGANGIIT